MKARHISSALEKFGVVSVTKLQTAMLLHSLSNPGSGLYITQILINLPESVNTKLLEIAWNIVINRHDILRTSVDMRNLNQLRLQIHPTTHCAIKYESLINSSLKDKKKTIRNFLTQDRSIDFDLNKFPLMRLHLFKFSAHDYTLIWTHHHAILAGNSVTLIIKEVFEFYDSLVKWKIYPLNSVLRYKKCEPLLAEDNSEAAKNYWQEIFRNFSKPNTISVPKNIANKKKFQQLKYIEINKKNLVTMEKFAADQHVTLSTLIQASWAILLSKYTDDSDLVFGTVNAVLNKEINNTAGLFINTLPVRIQLDTESNVAEILQSIRKQQLKIKEFINTPLDLVQKCTEVENGIPLFDTCVDYKSYSIYEKLKKNDSRWDKRNCVHYSDTNFSITLEAYREDNKLFYRLFYSPDRYSVYTINQIATHLKNISLNLIKNPLEKISNISVYSNEELNKITNLFNKTEVNYPNQYTVIDMFDKWVVNTPNSIAVSDSKQKLSFKKLNFYANNLATYLIKKHINPNELVGICLERSVGMVIATIAAIKAGAAYVPVEANYPDDRISYMLHDSGVRLLITQKKLIPRLKKINLISSMELIDIDGAIKSNSKLIINKNINYSNLKNLSYVIYTSGSTGKPKGVMIHNQGLTNLVNWHHETYQVISKTRASLIANFSFDAANWAIWAYITKGASLHIIDEHIQSDPDLLKQWLNANYITHCFLSTALAEIALKEHWVFPHMKYLLTGGDRLRATVSKDTNFKLINHYGPTETTVVSTSAECFPNKIPDIGKPISNTQIYILDKFLNSVPIGVIGEIHIGGEGLALGYWHKQNMTDEKFITISINNSVCKVYKTGDLARWKPDGNIEYIGRLDSQVKIRGFRVEVSEIENAIMQYPSVAQCIVLIKESDESKHMVAYIVDEKNTKTNVSELRNYLLRTIPEFMLPNFFIHLDKFPLTKNGKIDKINLPDAGKFILNATKFNNYSETESILIKIWAKVLKIDNITNKDNFFQLGGDSILGFQLAVRAKAEGLKFCANHLFQYPTIEQLASIIDANKSYNKLLLKEKLITGDVHLTPIQKWFFEKNMNNPGHFNQTCLLNMRGKTDIVLLEKAFRTLLHQHDALRMKFVYNPKEQLWHEIDRDDKVKNQFSIKIVDLSIFSRVKQVELIRKHNINNFKLNNELLVKVIYFKLGANNHDKVLIIIHHLVIDGVSWRILLEDLHHAYHQMLINKPISLSAKTTSFQHWSEVLTKYASSNSVRRELGYWNKQILDIDLHTYTEELKIDHVENIYNLDSVNKIKFVHKINLSFTVKETATVLRSINNAQEININDLLITALVLAFSEKNDNFCLHLEQEVHGRENIVTDNDLSHTVGWFTNIKPLKLSINNANNLLESLLTIRDQLHEVPGNGIGYGILRYSSKSKRIHYKLASSNRPKLGFNYLGRLDVSLLENPMFFPSKDGINLDTDEEFIRDHIIDVDGFVLNEKLNFTWSYSYKLHKSETVNNLSRRFKKIIFKLIGIIKNYNHELAPHNHYPLSPTQKGFLFHKLYSPEIDNYIIQHVFTLRGRLNIEKFKFSWESAFNNYDVFRIKISHNYQDKPLQYLSKKFELPWKQLDWSGFSKNIIQNKISDYKITDRQLGFDLEFSPLARATLIKMPEDSYFFMLTYHHIIMDGWSWAMVVNHGFENYENMVEQEKIITKNVPSYMHYINWLSLQEKNVAIIYWKKLLSDYNPDAVIANQEADYLQVATLLDTQLVKKLSNQAKNNQLTLNTIIQGIWALLLSCYDHKEDIVYGTIASDRPASLHQVEDMVGLMINTLPVRVMIKSQQSLLDYFKLLQEQLVQSREFGYVGLAEIQALFKRDSNNELFDSLFLYENYPSKDNVSKHIEIIDNIIYEKIHYKLICKVIFHSEITLFLEFNTAAISLNTAEHMLKTMNFLLEQAAQNMWQPISDIHWVNIADRRKLLAFGNHKKSISVSMSVIDKFISQVNAQPDKVALRFDNQIITYEELNLKSNQLAAYLLSIGVCANDIVGVSLIRNTYLIISLLALLRIGAAYLPLDPNLPKSRLEYILQKSTPKLVLTYLHTKKASDQTSTIRQIDIANIDFNQVKISENINFGKLNHLAYVLYTSGSTGEPKGVVIGQTALANFLTAISKEIPIDSHDVVLALTPYTFDISGLELYLPLIHGAEVVLSAPETISDTAKLIELLEKHKVTLMQATPVTWRLLLNFGWSNSQNIKMLIGGEALNQKIAADLLSEKHELWNLYGPTETTIWSTIHKVTYKDLLYPIMPIGKPLVNTEVYVLDKELRLLPPGAIGELYISGTSLAQGYLSSTNLTQARFITNPFNENNTRLYKTGDLVKWLPEGNLYYVMRDDEQVKVHGYRIELAEIEARLLSYPEIKQAAVLVVGEEILNKNLTAYLVLNTSDQPVTIETIREYLQKYLPNYMIPTNYIVLDTIPLTTSNKIDKNNLRRLGKNLLINEKKYIAPRDSQEQSLTAIWADALKLPANKISIEDNFFDLGGDSISAMMVVAKIQATFATKLTLKTLFTTPTIIKLNEYMNTHNLLIKNDKNNSIDDLPSPLIVLQEYGNKTPLFLFHPIGGTVFLYTSLVKALGVERPVYAIQDPGIEAEKFLFKTFAEMATYYVKLIKLQQPTGPYLLAGASFGANMAVEVARQLQIQGNTIAYIGLIDGWAIYPAKANNDRQWFENNLGRQHKFMEQFLPAAFKLPATLLELNWHRQQLLARYQPPTAAYPLTLYKSKILMPVLKTIEATYNHWDNYTTLPIKLYHTPGDHESMLLGENAKILATQINASIKYIK